MMRSTVAIAAIAIVILVCGGTIALSGVRPSVVMFDIDVGQGMTSDSATNATKAFRDCLRDTGKVDAVAFDADSSTVQRALLEKRITIAQLADYSGESVKIELARVLGFDYAAWGNVTLSEKVIRLNTSIAGVLKAAETWSFASTAGVSGTGSYDLPNAIQIAASSASNYYAREAFKNLAKTIEQSVDTSLSSQSVDTPKDIEETDLAMMGENSYKEGRLAEAIGLYSRAVTGEPTNVKYRIRLAQMYAAKGMLVEAGDELNRAIIVGGDKDIIEKTRQELIRPRDTSNAILPARVPKRQPAVIPPTPIQDSKARTRISQGDKLWEAGDTGGATNAYREAVVLNPNEWRAYERLAILFASVGRFADAKISLQELNSVLPNPSVEVLATRNALLTKAYDKRISAMVDHITNDLADFESHRTTREAYYASLTAVKIEVDSTSSFLDSIPIIQGQKNIQLIRSLTVGLISQAIINLIDFAESNSRHARSNAETFLDQARGEIEEQLSSSTSK